MNPFAEIISIVIDIYVDIILLRFFLQYFRADFYNPLSQFVVKATDPIVKPLRKIIPGIGGLDLSTLVAAWLVIIGKILLIFVLSTGFSNFNLLALVIMPIYMVIAECVKLYMFLIFVRAISSWFAQGGHNPIIGVIGQLTEPLLAKFRKILPMGSGFDFTPMLAILALLFTLRILDYYILPVIQKLVS